MERIWTRFYDSAVPHDIDTASFLPIPLAFDEIARKNPCRTALWYFGKRMTYRALEQEILRFAKGLVELGIKRGERVALHLPNVPQFIIAYFAILRMGAIAVPINPTYKGDELTHILRHSEATSIITITKFFHEVKEAAKDSSATKRIIVTNVKDYLPFVKKILFALFREKKEGHAYPRDATFVTFASLLKSRVSVFPHQGRKIRSPALLQYTGGTTGRPKGVIISQENLLASTAQLKAWLPDFQEGREVIAAVLPFFHIYGLTGILHTALLTGSSLVLFPEPNLEDLIGAFRKHKITIMPGVPLLFERLLTRKPPLKKSAFASLKFCVSGAAPLLPETESQFEKLSGAKLVQGYGLTEACVTHANPIYGTRKPGSIGIPFPSTHARIVDEEIGDVGPNIIGEIVVSGPQIMKGYWKDTAATDAVKKDNWLFTGDLGYYDEDGYFFIVDRKKDMIYLKGTGLKVYPSEVEEVIRTFRNVADVAVVGIDDGSGGEVPTAFVVLKEHQDEATFIQELKAYCEKNLALYKVPRTIHIVAELPKTFLGKPLRRVLKTSQ